MRILVVDDHPVFREGLVALLVHRGFAVLGEAADGLEALKQAEILRPDVVIVDLNMPRLDGLETTRQLKAKHPGIQVVGVSMRTHPTTVETMRRAGASAVVEKTGPVEELLAAIGSLCPLAPR